MSRSYRQCPACGKHALSIATRCPQCGHDLLAQDIRRQPPRDLRRFLPLVAVAGVVVAAAVLFALVTHWSAARDRQAEAAAAAAAEPPVVLDTARAAASPAMPDSLPGPDAVPLRARTWTKVHARRSVNGDVVAVLLPGDTVLADSLVRGWWRVALDGRVIGYAYVSTLAR